VRIAREMALHSQPTKDRYIGFVFLLITSIGWGLNWPVIKLVLRDWPPLFARGTAGLVAALALAALATLQRQRLSLPSGVLGRLGAASMLNVFAWMGFSTIAMVWLTVSEGALLVYTMPIWAMLFAWVIRSERPSLSGFAAVVLGLTGLLVLLGGAQITATPGKLPGVLLALGSAVLFAFSTVVFRSPLPIPPLTLTAWQVGLGCLPMVLIGVVIERPNLHALTERGWAAMAYMAAVPMGVCYLCWFAALRRLPSSTAALATLLTPLVGVFSAALLLPEPLGLRELSALILVLVAVSLAIRQG
jgi:drug/metabolite transporter (DMT)-like permease